MNFSLPRMPWYKWIDDKLEGTEWFVSVGLIVIVAVSVALLLRGDRVARTAWFVYLISP